MRNAGVSSGSSEASFNVSWLILNGMGTQDYGTLPTTLLAARTAGIADGTYLPDHLCTRIIYENQGGFLNFLYAGQSLPTLWTDPVSAYDNPAQPIIKRYAYPADLYMMSLLHSLCPSLTRDNPAYGSGAGQSLSNTPWTINGQGLCIAVAYDRITGGDFMEDIVRPTILRQLQAPSVFFPGEETVPPSFTGIVDFDFESWYPYFGRFRNVNTTALTPTATTAVTTWGDDNGEYFLRWCRTGSASGGWPSNQDLPGSHFTYCPQTTAPLATDAEAEALFYTYARSYWAAVRNAVMDQAPLSRGIQIYGWPRAPSYYQYAYFKNVPSSETNSTLNGYADTNLAFQIAEMTDPDKAASVITKLAQLAPSWYTGVGATTAPGVEHTLTYPYTTAPYSWSQYQRGKHLYAQAVSARAIADYYDKPLVPYITPSTFTDYSDLYGPAIDANTAYLLGKSLMNSGADGINLWGYYHTTYGNTESELVDGLALLRTHVIDPALSLRVPFADILSYNR